MTERTIPFSMKIVLGILIILSFSIIGAADTSPNYEYEKEFSLEKASSVPDNVDPVKFDTLSNSEQNAVLAGLSEYKEAEFEDIPDEFGKEGYVSINGQMYEYEVSPIVDTDPESLMTEGLLSGLLFGLCAIILAHLLFEVDEQFDLTGSQFKVLFIAAVVILGLFPLAQFMAFSMDGSGGKVVYLGPADSTEDAVEYSSLSMEQQAHVSTLLRTYNGDNRGLSSTYGSPPELGTDMDGKKLQELDTVVMTIDGERKYHNFVTYKKETNSLGLTDIQTDSMYYLLGLYMCLNFFLSISLFKEDEDQS